MARRDRFSDIDFESFITAPPVVDFIGPRYDHYREIWTKDYEKKRDIRKITTSLHLNWLALILSPMVWFFYRKMHMMAGMMILFYGFMTLYDYYKGETTGPGVLVGINVAIAFMAKGFYFSHIVRFMEKNRDTAPDVLEQRIAAKGGTSIAHAVIGVVSGVAVLVGFAVLGESLFGPIPVAEALPDGQDINSQLQ